MANTPPAEELPAYLACIPNGSSYPGFRPRARCLVDDPAQLPDVAGVKALVASYNAAISAVVSKEGALLVDLHALGVDAPGGLSALTGRDGFHPSTAGHIAVAGAFAAVMKAHDVEPAASPSPVHS